MYSNKGEIVGEALDNDKKQKIEGFLENPTIDDDKSYIGIIDKRFNFKYHLGIISHVKEIRDRVEVKLIVEPAEAGVSGTRISIEK